MVPAMRLEEARLQQLESGHPRPITSFPNSQAPEQKPTVRQSSAAAAAGPLAWANTGHRCGTSHWPWVSRKVSGYSRSGGTSSLAEFSHDILTLWKVNLYLLAFPLVVVPTAFSPRENAEVVNQEVGWCWLRQRTMFQNQ